MKDTSLFENRIFMIKYMGRSNFMEMTLDDYNLVLKIIDKQKKSISFDTFNWLHDEVVDIRIYQSKYYQKIRTTFNKTLK